MSEAILVATPSLDSHSADIADWCELKCLSSKAGVFNLNDLQKIEDESIDREAEDISERDIAQTEIVYKAQVALTERTKRLQDDYPFEITNEGRSLSLKPDLTDPAYVYLLCLFFSLKVRDDLDLGALLPAITHVERDLFQVCATCAAAGHVSGNAASFGWPRIDHSSILKAVTRIYKAIGDGIVVDKVPPGASPMAKDDGIDVIAWKPYPDGMAGFLYVLGQAGSGDGWYGKDLKGMADDFHHTWFQKPPATSHTLAMIVPFCVHSNRTRNPDYSEEVEERAFHERNTRRFGTLIERTRMPGLVGNGIAAGHKGFNVERLNEIQNVAAWVREWIKSMHVAESLE